MKATQILMDEHRLIERVLVAMQTAASRLSNGETIRPAFFINAALFFKNFADGCHHKKEEDILFAAMNPSGSPVSGGPLAVMLAEHEQGRDFIREIRAEAERWEKGDLSAQGPLAQNALGYAQLLRAHIYKEDNILFPMADQLLAPAMQEQVAADFDRAAEDENLAGIHEKYTALAEVLEKESSRRWTAPSG
jgi:hemerythrin-like domain-containing protein